MRPGLHDREHRRRAREALYLAAVMDRGPLVAIINHPPPPPPPVVQTTALARWKGGSGYTGAPTAVSNWTDVSGNGHDLTQATGTNKPPTGVVGGLTGLSGNGSSYYMQTAANFSYDMSKAHSLSGWVYLTGNQTNLEGRLLHIGAGDGWIGVNNSGDCTCLHYNGSSNIQITDTSPMSFNAWHLVTSTFDGTNLRLYLDGGLRVGPNNAAGGRNLTNVTCTVMSSQNGGSDLLGSAVHSNYLGSARFDNVCLTQTQIAAIYAAGANA